MSAFSVTCPLCRTSFPVPTELLGVNTSTNKVLVRMDRTELYGHLQRCAAERHAELPVPGAHVVASPTGELVHLSVSPRDLAGRVHRMLDMRAYVATGGSRACTMCGALGRDCLVQLEESGRGVPCCAACGNGNTHPAPGEAKGGCAEWAAGFREGQQ